MERRHASRYCTPHDIGRSTGSVTEANNIQTLADEFTFPRRGREKICADLREKMSDSGQPYQTHTRCPTSSSFEFVNLHPDHWTSPIRAAAVLHVFFPFWHVEAAALICLIFSRLVLARIAGFILAWLAYAGGRRVTNVRSRGSDEGKLRLVLASRKSLRSGILRAFFL
jgi:hypothetical protein